jgi:hypothetical protein
VLVHRPHPGELVDPILTLTAGGVRDVARVGPLLLGVGGDATFYRPPPLLQLTHGQHPVSYHLFVRVARRPGERMWDMTMGAHTMPSHHEM